MKYSPLGQFARLKQQLTQERDTIVARLAAINEVLGSEEVMSAPLPQSNDTGSAPQAQPTEGYTPREGSLPARILAEVAKAGGPMRVKDIAAALKKPAVLLSQACLLLRRKRLLKRRGRGAYALA